jgi:hypothetical protein
MDRTRWDRASATLQPGPIESPQYHNGPSSFCKWAKVNFRRWAKVSCQTQKVRLRQDAPLYPGEELDCRGFPRWREWYFNRRCENLRGLCLFGIACAFGSRGSRKPRLRRSVSRGGRCPYREAFCQLRVSTDLAWVSSPAWARGTRGLGERMVQNTRRHRAQQVDSRILRRSAGSCFRGHRAFWPHKVEFENGMLTGTLAELRLCL